MAKMNGVNSDMVKGPIGQRSTRIDPTDFERNNLSKGGVNHHLGGHKPGQAKSTAGTAKRK
jgi:hypothetical protein